MLPKPNQSTSLLAGIAIFAFLAVRSPAQAPALTDVKGPATWNRLYKEADEAFAAKNYDAAVTKLKELISALGTNKVDSLEMLYFNIGLGNLLGAKPEDAEEGFMQCLKVFPKGEYMSRCYLGIGQACMQQAAPEKKQRAIESLRIAAKDPKYRSEAGLALAQVLTEMGKKDEALAVFRTLMGADVRTPQQTTAAVGAIGLLAETGKLADLIEYLDRISNQTGVRDVIAWYANQVISRGDELVAKEEKESYEAALAIYRSVPPRDEILASQAAGLDSFRKTVKILEARLEAEKKRPIEQQHTNTSEILNAFKPAVAVAEDAEKAIKGKEDLDAALLMRRGRCLYYLERNEEALVCFRTIRNKYPTATDAKAAAYAEIVILNKLKNVPEIKSACDLFLRKYPDAEQVETVATLAGEILVQSGDWKSVGDFYRNLESRFPKSENIDRYVFFQALAFFYEASFAESAPIFDRFLKNYPKSDFVESALYYVAMSNFLSNKYKESLSSINDYLKKFPDGKFAGDMTYRLAFIDFNDKVDDQTEKIIRNLTSFTTAHPDDAAVGSMYCLMGDTYKKKDKTVEAIEAYKKAVKTDSLDDVVQYALESATTLMQAEKDWKGIAEMHGEFLQRKPNSQLALISVTWVAKMKAREGKPEEAAELITGVLKTRIADPSQELVEYLIDELVKTLVPKKKPTEINADEIDQKLKDILNKVIAGKENPTTAARIYYARARLAQMLKRNDRSDLYLKGIATSNAKTPAVLSPALLSVCGDILLKTGDLDGAEAMYRRLADRFKESNFSDAGPVGLGYVALARKKPDEALKIFDDALENLPGMSHFKEASLGKLQALVDLDQLEAAEKLALAMVTDKTFRGETCGKAYLLLGKTYRKQGTKSAGVSDAVSKDLLKKAYATYQRVYIAYQGTPDICAEAYWQAWETAKDLGDDTLAKETLKALKENPKLKNTEPFKKAAGISD